MRKIVFLLLAITACQAQSDENQVAAVLQQLEHAAQTGDGNAFVALWSRQSVENARKLAPHISPQPELHFRPLRIFVRGEEAAVLAQADADMFLTMTLVHEAGAWKIDQQSWSDHAPDANSVYAALPPPEGAFSRAGSPWDRVAAALPANEAARKGWQIRATFDESYLYLRLEYNTPLPPPGSTTETPPTGWPVLKIDVAGAGEFVLYDDVNIGDQATFGADGRANSHRPFEAYMIRLERNHREVFSASANMHSSPLIQVNDRFYDIRIPLAAMGIADSRGLKMTIGDAEWPKSAILSMAVARFDR